MISIYYVNNFQKRIRVTDDNSGSIELLRQTISNSGRMNPQDLLHIEYQIHGNDHAYFAIEEDSIDVFRDEFDNGDVTGIYVNKCYKQQQREEEEKRENDQQQIGRDLANQQQIGRDLADRRDRIREQRNYSRMGFDSFDKSFDGAGSYVYFETLFKHHVNLYGFNKRDQFILLQRSLKDPAAKFITSNNALIIGDDYEAKFDSLKNLIKSNFAVQDLVESYRIKLSNCKQGKSELKLFMIRFKEIYQILLLEIAYRNGEAAHQGVANLHQLPTATEVGDLFIKNADVNLRGFIIDKGYEKFKKIHFTFAEVEQVVKEYEKIELLRNKFGSTSSLGSALKSGANARICQMESVHHDKEEILSNLCWKGAYCDRDQCKFIHPKSKANGRGRGRRNSSTHNRSRSKGDLSKEELAEIRASMSCYYGRNCKRKNCPYQHEKSHSAPPPSINYVQSSENKEDFTANVVDEQPSQSNSSQIKSQFQSPFHIRCVTKEINAVGYNEVTDTVTTDSESGSDRVLKELILSASLSKITYGISICNSSELLRVFIDSGSSISIVSTPIFKQLSRFKSQKTTRGITAWAADKQKLHKLSERIIVPVRNRKFLSKQNKWKITKEFIEFWHFPDLENEMIILGMDGIKLMNLGLYNREDLRWILQTHQRGSNPNIVPEDEDVSRLFKAIEYRNEGEPGLYRLNEIKNYAEPIKFDGNKLNPYTIRSLHCILAKMKGNDVIAARMEAVHALISPSDRSKSICDPNEAIETSETSTNLQSVSENSQSVSEEREKSELLRSKSHDKLNDIDDGPSSFTKTLTDEEIESIFKQLTFGNIISIEQREESKKLMKLRGYFNAFVTHNHHITRLNVEKLNLKPLSINIKDPNLLRVARHYSLSNSDETIFDGETDYFVKMKCAHWQRNDEVVLESNPGFVVHRNISIRTRIALFFMYLCTVMAITALFYGLAVYIMPYIDVYHDINGIIVSIISAMLSTLPVYCVQQLFVKSKPKMVRKSVYLYKDIELQRVCSMNEELDDGNILDYLRESHRDKAAKYEHVNLNDIYSPSLTRIKRNSIGEKIATVDTAVEELRKTNSNVHRLQLVDDIRLTLLNTFIQCIACLLLICWTCFVALITVIFTLQFDFQYDSVPNSDSNHLALYENECWQNDKQLLISSKLSYQSIAALNDNLSSSMAMRWSTGCCVSVLVFTLLLQPIFIYITTWLKIWMFSHHLTMKISATNIYSLVQKACCRSRNNNYHITRHNTDFGSGISYTYRRKSSIYLHNGIMNKVRARPRRSSSASYNTVHPDRPFDVLGYLCNDDLFLSIDRKSGKLRAMSSQENNENTEQIETGTDLRFRAPTIDITQCTYDDEDYYKEYHYHEEQSNDDDDDDATQTSDATVIHHATSHQRQTSYTDLSVTMTENGEFDARELAMMRVAAGNIFDYKADIIHEGDEADADEEEEFSNIFSFDINSDGVEESDETDDDDVALSHISMHDDDFDAFDELDDDLNNPMMTKKNPSETLTRSETSDENDDSDDNELINTIAKALSDENNQDVHERTTTESMLNKATNILTATMYPVDDGDIERERKWSHSSAEIPIYDDDDDGDAHGAIVVAVEKEENRFFVE